MNEDTYVGILCAAAIVSHISSNWTGYNLLGSHDGSIATRESLASSMRGNRDVSDIQANQWQSLKSMDRDLTHGRDGKPASGNEDSQKFSSSRNAHGCWEADCRNNSKVHQQLCTSFYMAKNTKII